MRTDRRRFLATSGLTVLGMAGASEPGVRHKVSSHHSRPIALCEIPPYEYLSTLPAASTVAVSQIAELLRSPTLTPGLPAVAGSTLVYFKLVQASLVNGHCSISNVALTIRDDGYWSLGLQADQNPIVPQSNPPLVAASPAPPRIILRGATLPSRFTAHIKRNQFIIRVRGYGAYPDLTDPATPSGRPILFALQIPPFWVERELPLRPLPFEGKNGLIAEYFKSVDRVEVELTYR